MAKCKGSEWFVVLTKAGNIDKNEDGVAIMAKTKDALFDCYLHCAISPLEGKDVVKIQIPKIVQI